MPKVTIKREGLTVEADVSFDELKELVGLNHIAPHAKSGPVEVRRTRAHAPKEPDIDGFMRQISDRAKKFLSILAQHSHGIDAEDLAPLLGFNKAAQIGGLTGPGISKIAERCGLNVDDIYTSKNTFPQGKRVRMFYPGKLINELLGKRIPA